jgi:hypothetical protein
MSNKLPLAFRLSLAILGIASWTSAAGAGDIKLTIVPDGDGKPDEVTIWDESSPTHLDTEPPITYLLAWPPADITKELDVRAEWNDVPQDIGLKLYKQYGGRAFEIPIVLPKLTSADLNRLATRCLNNSATTYLALLDDYYLCRQVFRESPDDSLKKLRAAKGWFDTAYRLSVLTHTPIRWDTEIANIMQGYEDRAAWDDAFNHVLRDVVQPRYVKQLTNKAAIAELRFVNDVGSLISAGALEDALALNRYMWGLFSDLSRETGEALINGVTDKTFADNDALIRTRLEEQQKRVPASH